MHIEVLQEKIDELEKAKEVFDKKIEQDKKDHEKKLKTGFTRLMDAKNSDIEKLQKEVKRQREILNESV